MVEVFDFKKDFITGKETRKSKFKDNSITKGVATIQLFDKNNGLIEETVSNNFINNIYEGAYGYRFILNALNGGASSFNCVKPMQFGQIHLRNGDFEEDKDTLFMRGDLVGWCPRTDINAGTDSARGVYNASESFVEITNDGYYHAHMVYDFLTSQANGTISHVYWTPQLYSNTNLAKACLSNIMFNGVNYIDTGISSGTLKVDVRDDLFIYKNYNYYKVKNRERFLNGFESCLIDESSPSEYIGQNHRINSELYIKPTIESVAGTPTNRKCNLTLELINSKTGEIEKTVNFDIINDFANMKELSSGASTSSGSIQIQSVNTCTETGNVYMTMYVKNIYVPVVYPDGSVGGTHGNDKYYLICYNILKDSWIIQPNIKDYTCFSMGGKIPVCSSVKFEKNKYFLLPYAQNSSISVYNEDDMSFETIYLNEMVTDFQNSNIQNYVNSMYGYDYSTNTIIGKHQTSNTQIVLNRFLPYTSHTKLPSPVTKTNTTTMKVSYDYYIQAPNLFAEKGKEFEWNIEG